MCVKFNYGCKESTLMIMKCFKNAVMLTKFKWETSIPDFSSAEKGFLILNCTLYSSAKYDYFEM